jgi:predicted nuclease of restriction endonuclease-like (RecB) superfamily
MLHLDTDYVELFNLLKQEIGQSQSKAAFLVARELMTLYWRVGFHLDQALKRKNWGDSLLEQLANDFHRIFPEIEGFSKRNLYRMRKFFLTYPIEDQFVTQAVSQIPWGHNVMIFQKLKESRLWYAQKTLEHRKHDANF